MSVKVVTSAHQGSTSNTCVEFAAKKLKAVLAGIDPDLIIAFCSATTQPNVLVSAIQETFLETFKDVPLMGCTSDHGVMTDKAFFSETPVEVGFWALCDQEGRYGVGYADISYDLETQVKAALNQALEQAEFLGEQPELVWLHAASGYEEAILNILHEQLGDHVMIVGGSCATQQKIPGVCFDQTNCGEHGLAIAVFFPSVEIEIIGSAQSGYSPSGQEGLVTKASGRVLKTIDDQPAAEVYNRWTNGALSEYLDNRKIQDQGFDLDLDPLGINIGAINCEAYEIPYYKLIGSSPFS